MSKNYEEQYLEVVASNPNAIIYVPKDEISELIILTAIENGHVNNLNRIIDSENISFDIIEGLLKNYSAKEIVNLLIETDFAIQYCSHDNVNKLIPIIKQLYSKDYSPSQSETNYYVAELAEKYEEIDGEFGTRIVSSILFDPSIHKVYKYYLVNINSFISRLVHDILEAYLEAYSDNPNPIAKEIFFLLKFNNGFDKYREIFPDASFEEYVTKKQQAEKDIKEYNGEDDLI